MAEEVRGREFGGGVEASEEEFVVFQLCGFEDTLVQDADYEVVDAVGGEGERGEGEGCEVREDGDEDLFFVYYYLLRH